MFNTEGFTTIKGLTDALMRRQELLSNNLANMETKNYVRQDIDFSKVLSGLKSNLVSEQEGNDSLLSTSRYRDYSGKMTLESEMSKLYENHMKYMLMIKSISHHFEHMKKALEVRAS